MKNQRINSSSSFISDKFTDKFTGKRLFAQFVQLIFVSSSFFAVGSVVGCGEGEPLGFLAAAKDKDVVSDNDRLKIQQNCKNNSKCLKPPYNYNSGLNLDSQNIAVLMVEKTQMILNASDYINLKKVDSNFFKLNEEGIAAFSDKIFLFQYYAQKNSGRLIKEEDGGIRIEAKAETIATNESPNFLPTDSLKEEYAKQDISRSETNHGLIFEETKLKKENADFQWESSGYWNLLKKTKNSKFPGHYKNTEKGSITISIAADAGEVSSINFNNLELATSELNDLGEVLGKQNHFKATDHQVLQLLKSNGCYLVIGAFRIINSDNYGEIEQVVVFDENQITFMQRKDSSKPYKSYDRPKCDNSSLVNYQNIFELNPKK